MKIAFAKHGVVVAIMLLEREDGDSSSWFWKEGNKKEDYKVSIDKEFLQLVEPKVTITFLEGLSKI